jgi:hypothetical protein
MRRGFSSWLLPVVAGAEQALSSVRAGTETEGVVEEQDNTFVAICGMLAIVIQSNSQWVQGAQVAQPAAKMERMVLKRPFLQGPSFSQPCPAWLDSVPRPQVAETEGMGPLEVAEEEQLTLP